MYLTLLTLKLINWNKLRQTKHKHIYVTHKLVNTTRNNNLSYKDVVSSIYVDEEVSFSLNTDLCDCEKLKILWPTSKTYHNRRLNHSKQKA